MLGHQQNTVSVSGSRVGQRETGRELGAMGGLSCSAPEHRHCFYPNLIHQLDKYSADSIGIKVTALCSQDTWGGPTFSWSTWGKKGTGQWPFPSIPGDGKSLK